MTVSHQVRIRWLPVNLISVDVVAWLSPYGMPSFGSTKPFYEISWVFFFCLETHGMSGTFDIRGGRDGVTRVTPRAYWDVSYFPMAYHEVSISTGRVM
jgi:hypothetical protein